MKTLCIKTNNNKTIDYLLDNLNKTELKGAKNKFSLSKYEQVALECNKE